MGSEARIITTEENHFAAFSLATTDSYKDESGEWQDKETIWHSILAFNPVVIEVVKNLKKGTRLKITGSLSYRPFEVMNGEGEIITKKEAAIIAAQVEQAPLVKKKKEQTHA
jgi:single-strand DNA-binding protein